MHHLWGAAETVTGPRVVVDTGSARMLVDRGLFQSQETAGDELGAVPVDPSSTDAVVLTHAPIDHSGYLPAPVGHGFRGDIWCTPATADLAGILLPDTAHL